MTLRGKHCPQCGREIPREKLIELAKAGRVPHTLNVFVFAGGLPSFYQGGDGDGSEASTRNRKDGTPITFLSLKLAKNWSLSHGLAHQLLGHTRGSGNPISNTFYDVYINQFILPNAKGSRDVLRKGAANLFP